MKAYSFFLPLLIALPLAAQDQSNNLLRAKRLVSGLQSPCFISHEPGNSDSILILERTSGKIQILDFASGTLAEDPFFTVPGTTSVDTGGLLGLAFHPDYENNGLFFTSSTGAEEITRVLKHNINTTTTEIVFQNPHPPKGHKGGWLGFGPDGMLYLSTGDGGSGNDPLNSGQAVVDNPATPGFNEGYLGCIMRFDVNGDDFPENPNKNYKIPPSNPFSSSTGDEEKEIWAFGLRNPFRCSFDSLTGDFYIADVGQAKTDEVNILNGDYRPTAATIANFGWKICEGTAPRGLAPGAAGCELEGHIPPAFQYGNGPATFGGYSVTGGYVYRGSAMPWLRGTYLYGDFVKEDVRALRYNSSTGEVSESRRLVDLVDASEGAVGSIVGFGEDAQGEIYFCNNAEGEVYKIHQDPYSLFLSSSFSLDELADSLTSGSSADPDLDGLGNLVEFFGTSPTSAGDSLPLTRREVIVDGKTYFEFEMAASPIAKDINVILEETGDLVNGPWIPSDVIASNPETGVYQFRTTVAVSEASRRFVRLRFTQP